MSNAPPPKASPKTKAEVTDEVTGEHELPFATHEYVKAKQAKAEKLATESLADAIVAKVRSLWAVALSTVALTVTVLFGMDARSQNKVDAGTGPLKDEIAEIKKEMKELKTKQQQAEVDRARDTGMLENLSRERGIPVPPPAPKVAQDGGG